MGRIAVVLTGVVVLGWGVSSAEDCAAEAEPGSTWVVFASFREGDFASSLFAVKPDGTGECQISRHSPKLLNVLDAQVSSDGSAIVFSRGGNDRKTSVWAMQSDGRKERRLTEPVMARFANGSAAATWSPDRRSIAFVADDGGNRVVLTMDPDGSNMVELTRGEFPKWSPDGKRIAYVAHVAEDDPSRAVWTMNAVGQELHQLTRDGNSNYPEWSPDGKRILFSRQVGKSFDLFVMEADGSEMRALTKTPERSETHPAWSPDGAWIAFLAKAPDAPDGWQRSVFVMPAEGGQARQITPAEYDDMRPSWMVVPPR